MKKGIGLLLAIIMLTSFLAGCASKDNGGGDQGKPVDIKDIHQAIKDEFGEDYYPNREIELDEIESFTGIKEEDMEEFIAEAPMINVSIDTFMAIKAKEGKADLVEEKLEQYRTYLVEDSMQYPMNMPKVNASKVVRHGDYVFFLMLGKQDENMEDAESKEALEFAQKEVKRAEDVIDEFFK